MNFTEETNQPKTVSTPLSHLSVEVGHLYLEDIVGGQDALVRKFSAVAPWVDAVALWHRSEVAPLQPRLSTCFLIDDYFTPESSPAEIVPVVLAAADIAGVQIDYLARESGCAVDDDVEVAKLVLGQLVAEPEPETTGLRPPTTVSGWLSNGRRSPGSEPRPAMSGPWQWLPPIESAVGRHSIFLDVELWSEHKGERLWSCPFLAAIWQLARLGMLRDNGAAILQPVAPPKVWPDSWLAMPAVVRLNEAAKPFSAYATMSVLEQRFLPIEHSVRTILSQIPPDPAVFAQIVERAAGERMVLQPDVVGRIAYILLGRPWTHGPSVVAVASAS